MGKVERWQQFGKDWAILSYYQRFEGIDPDQLDDQERPDSESGGERHARSPIDADRTGLAIPGVNHQLLQLTGAARILFDPVADELQHRFELLRATLPPLALRSHRGDLRPFQLRELTGHATRAGRHQSRDQRDDEGDGDTEQRGYQVGHG